MAIADLLAAARAAHQAYRLAAGRIDRQGTVSQRPDLPACGAHVRRALSLRVDAARLDPTHIDLAWAEDQHHMGGIPSDDMISFYAGYLALESLPDCSDAANHVGRPTIGTSTGTDAA